jgi:hypothetical protein
MSELAEVPLRPLQIVTTPTDAAAEALLRRHFHAQHARSRSWQDVSLESLAPHHRNLMMTDGTVTRMLEAYTFESVEARCVEQFETTAATTEAVGFARPPRTGCSSGASISSVCVPVSATPKPNHTSPSTGYPPPFTPRWPASPQVLALRCGPPPRSRTGSCLSTAGRPIASVPAATAYSSTNARRWSSPSVSCAD